MLKVTAMKVGQVSYLVDDAIHDDYLSEGGEAPGVWIGRGAEKLGLSGPVDAATLTNLLKGMSPDGSTELIQHRAIRKDMEHTAGTMLTVNQPKSVSIAAVLGNPWLRAHIEQTQLDAAKAVIRHCEDHLALARRGSGGRRIEHCDIIAACHLHLANRNGDCHVHSHLTIPNIAIRHDGTTGTLNNKPFFDHQLELGSLYRTELAIGLRKAGFELEADGTSFRIVGIPRELERATSTRRPEILAEMAARGLTGGAGSDEAATSTRKPKQHFSLEAIEARTRRAADAIGFGEADIRALLTPHSTRLSESNRQEMATPSAPQSGNVIRFPANGKSETQAGPSQDTPAESSELRGFRDYVRNLPPRSSAEAAARGRSSAGSSPRDVVPPQPTHHATGEAAATPNRSVDELSLKRLIFRAMEVQIPKDNIDRLIDHLFDKPPQNRQEREKLERQLGTPEERQKRLNTILTVAEKAAGDNRHFLSAQYVSRQFGKVGGQGEQFRDAAIDIMSHRGAAVVVQTGVGTERDTFLKTLGELYRKAGYNVVGVAPTGSAATSLEASTAIKTHTATHFLFRTAPSAGTLTKHFMSQMAKAVMNHPTYWFERWNLDRQTVVLVSGTQNLNSQQVQSLQEAAGAGNSKIVFVGDNRQFKTREPFNTFESLAQRLGTVRLPDSARQHEPWAELAVEQVACGDVTGALSQYAHANHLHLADDHAQAAGKLVRQWAALPKAERGADTLIITATANDARVLSKAAQYARQQRGELGWVLKQRVDGGWIYRHDRVRFAAQAKQIGYRTGDQGTVTKIGLDTLTVRLDRTERKFGFQRPITVQVSRAHYKDLTLGYAIDAFHAQSASGKRAFVLTDADPIHPDALRTQLSRASGETRVFAARHRVDEEVEQIHDLVKLDHQRAALSRSLAPERQPSRSGIFERAYQGPSTRDDSVRRDTQTSQQARAEMERMDDEQEQENQRASAKQSQAIRL
jgi:conjugative relaxase-like TrwC/TraI family protein